MSYMYGLNLSIHMWLLKHYMYMQYRYVSLVSKLAKHTWYGKKNNNKKTGGTIPVGYCYNKICLTVSIQIHGSEYTFGTLLRINYLHNTSRFLKR